MTLVGALALSFAAIGPAPARVAPPAVAAAPRRDALALSGPARSEQAWAAAIASARDLPDTTGKLAVLVRALASSQVLWRKLPRGAEPGGPGFRGHPYDLDGLRPAKQIVAEGIGGSCGSHGKVLADALLQAGASPEDVYLVDMVGENERRAATRGDRRASASGHMFLLVKDAKAGWLLVNSTSDALEAVPFQDPATLKSQMAKLGYAKDPLHVRPATCGPDGKAGFPNLLQHTERGPDGKPMLVGPDPATFGDLVPFRVVKSVDYPNHAFRDRVREVVRVVPR